MEKIFISYTTRDKIVTVDFLKMIDNYLNKKYYVFIDLLHNNSENKQDRVIEEVLISDCLILITTNNIKKSNWVQRELEIASYRNIPIYKICYTGNWDSFKKDLEYLKLFFSQ